MDIRAKQGGSAIVYGIVSVLLAIGVIGAVYAVQKRANGEQIGPMEIASQLNPTRDENSTEQSANEQSSNEQSSNEETEKQKAAEEQARNEQQTAAEEKAQQQRREAAAEARKQEAEEKRAAEQKAAEQQKREESAPSAAGASDSQQMPPTGGPSALPQTGPADLVVGAFVLLVLGYSVIKFSFSQAYVNGR